MFHWDDRRCVRSHNNIPPASVNATLPHQHASSLNPPPALIPPVRANRWVETNGEELLGGEDAAGAVLSKATSHLLSLSHTTATISPPPYPTSPGHPLHRRGEGDSPGSALLSACSSFEVSWARIWTVFTWRHPPCCVCQPEVITALQVALTVMTRWGRCGEVGRAPEYISVWGWSYSLGCGADKGAPKWGLLAWAWFVKISNDHGQ